MSDAETAEQKQGMEHLALVQALSHEISSAISAIERNDMADLATRVAAQEAIALKLNRKDAHALQQACASYRATAQTPSDNSLWHKIREQYRALDQLNKVYYSLIQRSQQSLELIGSLYRGHGHRYGKDPGNRPAKSTWSCDV
jgi:hypothetical protein